MVLTCLFVWIWPELAVKTFGANEPDLIGEGCYALSVFAISLIPFCYIYVIMIVYKLYNYHQIALFISFALSLTVIPVLWLMSKFAPNYLWFSYLIAYIIEMLAIFILHKKYHVKFELKEIK